MSDEKLGQIDAKIDKITDKLNVIDITLVAQHVTLQEHIKRSEAAEKAIDIIKQELKPIQTHVAIVQVVGTVLGWLIMGGIGLYLLQKLFH